MPPPVTVSVRVFPEQMAVSREIVTEGNGLTVTLAVVLSRHVPEETTTLYNVEEFGLIVIAETVAPLLHK